MTTDRPSVEPTVSVVIPCFNAREWLHQCVSSCLAAGEPILEVIVVDDGSTDSSIDSIAELRQENPDRLKCARQDNRGGPAARSLGQSMATGEWLYFLDADDLLLPNALNAMLDAAGSSDVVYGNAVLIDEKGERIGERNQAPTVRNGVASILFGAPLNGTALIRRSRSGPFWDAKFQAVDEFYYFASLAANGRTFKHTDNTSLAYRQHRSDSRLANRGLDYGNALAQAFLALAPQLRAIGRDDLDLRAYLRWIFLDLGTRGGNADERRALFTEAAALRVPLRSKFSFAFHRYGARRVGRMSLAHWGLL